MNNQQSIRAAYLAHMTPEEKKKYNKKYYQEHKEEYWGVKSGVDRFKNERQRPHTITYDYKNDKTGRNWSHDVTYDKDSWRRLQDGLSSARSYGKTIADGWVDQGNGSKLKIRGTVQSERRSTPDLNARTSAIQRAQQSANRLSTPGLDQRLANMKAYAQPLRKTGLSGIADSAVAKGKSIVKGLTSLWKLGWK